MKIKATNLRDVWRIEPDVFTDFRGDYVMNYNKELYDTAFSIDFVEQDLSVSSKGVLRGIHYSPNCWKLYECLHGAMYYVFVNCDKEDSEFGKWESYIVDDRNHHQYIKHPRYGAGFYALKDDTILHYMQSQYYDPKNPDQQTFVWDTRFCNPNKVKEPYGPIWWPDPNPILSQRDQLGRYIKEGK